jgi:hypothetical protein
MLWVVKNIRNDKNVRCILDILVFWAHAYCQNWGRGGGGLEQVEMYGQLRVSKSIGLRKEFSVTLLSSDTIR